jgi:hypothetical protein
VMLLVEVLVKARSMEHPVYVEEPHLFACQAEEVCSYRLERPRQRGSCAQWNHDAA